ncbi:head-tail adaptor protein [Rhodalgimonas zhirmunskyi]|uniref:Head-tail adaptor protein n=1 Tax=Rhodalgimonas zhirmunskyi TaxID=2964767 RepID=A0AAJ1U2N5_9RHOB|nr:head-tail adaptor protein [Rhodoalgimonas zhirmunskyi]MDQ2092530.1 head-tail adaptor protein [Rhodoalgimonas zhirmunskyi]
MNLPLLNRRLMLEGAQRVADGAGGFTKTWVPLGAHWAEVKPRTGRERAGEAVSVSTMGYRITVRGAPVGMSARPQPDQRFREGTRIFLIRAVAERDPDGRYLTCFADEEVVA